MDMHPSNGDTPTIVHIPQKPNRMATVTIRRLSVLLFFNKNFKRNPKDPPTIRTTRLEIRGIDKALISNTPRVMDEEIETAIEKAIKPTTSSSATTPRRVSTKSPLAPVCLIVIRVEAGAVAEARAERMREKPNSSFKKQ